MSFHLQRIVETPHGVYQPSPLRFEGAALGVALFAIAAALRLGRISPVHALLYVAPLVATALYRLFEYRKFGLLGRPCVAVIEDTLVFARPNDTRGALRFALNELQQLSVYGRAGRRTYRFVRHDGTTVEAVPLWGPRVEASVLQFLQRALPASVTVAEPQTLFASIRGDGP